MKTRRPPPGSVPPATSTQRAADASPSSDVDATPGGATQAAEPALRGPPARLSTGKPAAGAQGLLDVRLDPAAALTPFRPATLEERYDKALVARLADVTEPGAVTLPGRDGPPSASGTLVVVNKGPSLRGVNEREPGHSSVMLMDLASGELRKDITHYEDGTPMRDGPHEVALSPSGKLAAAPNYGLQTQGKPTDDPVHGGGGHSLTLIDVAGASARVIELEPYFRPHGITWLDDEHCVVTCDGKDHNIDDTGYLLIVDVTTNEIEKAIATGQLGTHLVQPSKDGEQLYASNIQSGSMVVADIASGEVVKTIPTGRGAEGFDVSPDGSEIWVGNLEEDTLSVIDTETLEVKAKWRQPGGPIRVIFTPEGDHVTISNRFTNDVSVYDWRTKQEKKRIEMDMPRMRDKGPEWNKSSVPMIVAPHPTADLAYIGNSHSGFVTVFDTNNWDVQGHYKAGTKPDPLTVAP